MRRTYLATALVSFGLAAFFGKLACESDAIARNPLSPARSGLTPTAPPPNWGATLASSLVPETGANNASFSRAAAGTQCINGVMTDLGNNAATFTQPIADNGTCGTVPGTGIHLSEPYTGAFVSLHNDDLSSSNWPDADSSSPTRVTGQSDPYNGEKTGFR